MRIFALNYYSVKTFAIANNLISALKFAVPVLVMVALLYHFKPANFSMTEFAPMALTAYKVPYLLAVLFLRIWV